MTKSEKDNEVICLTPESIKISIRDISDGKYSLFIKAVNKALIESGNNKLIFMCYNDLPEYFSFKLYRLKGQHCKNIRKYEIKHKVQF
jgi:hypothetical protein